MTDSPTSLAASPLQATELPQSVDPPACERDSQAAKATLVSVVIPCYNYARFLDQAIQSALDQNYPAIEIVVVNDGSTDDPAAVVARFPMVQFVTQENRGLAAARNTGLAHCKGDLVVFLDADDRLLPEAIVTGARLLEANPALGFAVGYSTLISGDGLAQPTVNKPGCEGDDAYVSLLRRNTIRNPGTVLFRRQIVETVGGFAPGVDACADYALYLRISRSYPVVFHDVVVSEYRRHSENMSNNSAEMLRQALCVLRRQRSYLVTRARRQAFRDGIRNIRIYYGEQLVTQIRMRIRKRSEWGQLLRDLGVLIRCHPAGVVEHAARKISTLWRGRDPGALGA
jgi:glycosyltransferase involved in cell wall biosynthesis